MVKDGFHEEVKHSDSDVLLFHFLGLDHIGHAFSARKDLVNQKLEEMDLFVAELQSWIEEDDIKNGRRTLTLVMGDHGMTVDGNHGGGSPEETRAAAVFLSPNVKFNKRFDDWKSALIQISKTTVHQEDIAATLTSLLDSGKPLSNGFGKLIPEVVKAFDSSETHFYHNLIHLLRYPFKKRSTDIESTFTEILTTEPISEDDLIRWSDALKNSINSVGFQYADKKLLGSLVLMAFIACLSLGYLCSEKVNMMSIVEASFLIIFCLAQSTTSFIAEEQVISHAAFSIMFFVWFSCSFRKDLSLFNVKSALIVILIHRVAMSWSGVGAIWRSSTSISDYLKSSDRLLFGSIVLALSIVTGKLAKGVKLKNITTLLAFGAAYFSVFFNKLNYFRIDRALTAQLGLVAVLYLALVEKRHSCIVYLFMILNRPAQSLIIALLFVMFEELNKLLSISSIAFSPLLVMSIVMNSFYAMGLWNSVSAVDLTFGAAFTSTFDIRIAPIVLSIYFFSGPLSAFICTSFGDISKLIYMRLIIEFFACLFAFHHRYHPWIFDFFAPKILFQILWSVFFAAAYFFTNIFKNNQLKK
jgi:ethanolaminephosphotransferase